MVCHVYPLIDPLGDCPPRGVGGGEGMPARKSTPEKGESPEKPIPKPVVYDVPSESNEEAKVEAKTETIDIVKKIEEIAEKVIKKASEVEDWVSFIVKQVDGSTTSLMLQIAVNAKEKAVMLTLRTPQVKNKPNMLKLPSVEHLKLLRDMAQYIIENYEKIEKLFQKVCEKLGTEPMRRKPRRPMGETLEL